MITNTEAAQRLGCDVSTVSRLRSGDRTPSTEMVLSIEQALDWSGQAQLNALRAGKYAMEFDNLLEHAK